MAEHHKRAAALGGAITHAKYGTEHYSKIGALGGAKTKARGPEFFKEIGRKGASRRGAHIRNAAFEEAAQMAEQHNQTARLQRAEATTDAARAKWDAAAETAHVIASAIRSLMT